MGGEYFVLIIAIAKAIFQFGMRNSEFGIDCVPFGDGSESLQRTKSSVSDILNPSPKAIPQFRIPHSAFRIYLLEVHTMKKKTKLLIASGAVLAAAVLLFPEKPQKNSIPDSAPTLAATVSDRIDYFASHGWEVEEICSRNVTIPSDFSAVYEEYACLQDKQGLPLREYAGKNAQLYVYEVKNYSPESKKLLAELLVCDDTAVASMVYSEDGGSLKMAVS